MTIDDFKDLMIKCGFSITEKEGKACGTNMVPDLDQFNKLSGSEFYYNHILIDDYLIIFDRKPHSLKQSLPINIKIKNDFWELSNFSNPAYFEIGLNYNSELFPDPIYITAFISICSILKQKINKPVSYNSIASIISKTNQTSTKIDSFCLLGSVTDSPDTIKAYTSVLMQKSLKKS